MQVTKIETGYDKNNHAYKKVQLSGMVMGKNRFNVFPRHTRYDDVTEGAEFSAEEFVKNGDYLELLDPDKGVKKTYTTNPRKTFEVARTMETKRENIMEAQGNKEYSIKVASTFSNAVLITVELMKEDKLLDWHTTFTDVRNWLWNHYDIEKPNEPAY